MKGVSSAKRIPAIVTPILFVEDRRDDQQNGNDCGFIALNKTRQEVIAFIKANLRREEIRRLLLPEMKMLCAVECTNAIINKGSASSPSSPRLQELLSISEALVDAEDIGYVIDEINKLLNKPGRSELLLSEEDRERIIALFNAYEAAHTSVQPLLNECNDLLGFPDGNRKNFDELVSFFNLRPQANKPARNKFVQAEAVIGEVRARLEAVLITPEMVTRYVENYYQKNNGWMAFQPAKSGGNNSSIIDIIAMMKKCQIVVWQSDDNGNQLKPLYITENYTETGMSLVQSHMKYDGSMAGHFTALNLQVGEAKVATLEGVGQITGLVRKWPMPGTGIRGVEEQKSPSTKSVKPINRNLAQELEEADKAKVADKYDAFFDDSSSEEDNQELDDQGIEEFKNKVERLVEKSVPEAAENVELSFLVHEFGVRLFKSKEVVAHYYPLKEKFLSNNVVLPRVVVQQCIEDALLNAFQKTFLNVKIESHKRELDSLTKSLLQNQRVLFKGTSKDKLPARATNDLDHFLTSKLPGNNQHSVKDPKLIKQLVIEVCDESGLTLDKADKQLGNIKLRYDKNSKARLKKAKFNSPLKEQIKAKLLKVTSAITIESFVRGNKFESTQTLKDVFKDFFWNCFKENIREANLNNNVERSVLPGTYSPPLADDYSVTRFLAFNLLFNRSNTRLIRNWRQYDDITGVGERVVMRSIQFPGIDFAVPEQQTISSGGTRTDMVLTFGSYKNSLININKIKAVLKVDDKIIAGWIARTLQGKANEWLSVLKISSFQKKSLAEFISTITYVLFGTEVARAPGSLIIHQMALELVQSGQYTFDDLFKEGTPALPAAVKGIMPSLRWKNINYQAPVDYQYDKTTGNQISSNDDALLHQSIDLEAQIVKDWVNLKSPHLKHEDTHAIVELIIASCLQWYGVEVDAQKILVDLCCFNLPDLEEDDINELDLNELKILTQIVKNSDEEQLMALFEAQVSLSEIVHLYSTSEDAFAAIAGNDNALGILGRSDVTVEDLVGLYEENENMFEDIVKDEDRLIEDEGHSIHELRDKWMAAFKRHGRRYQDSEGEEFDMYAEVANEVTGRDDNTFLGYDWNSDDSENRWGYRDDRSEREEYDPSEHSSARSSSAGSDDDSASAGLEDDMARLGIGSGDEKSSSDNESDKETIAIGQNQAKFLQEIIFRDIERKIFKEYSAISEGAEMLVLLNAKTIKREHLVRYCELKFGMSCANITSDDNLHTVSLTEHAAGVLESLPPFHQRSMSI